MSQERNILSAESGIALRRNKRNRIELHRDGEVMRIGEIMPAFPLSDRDRYIQLTDEQGEEIGIVRDIGELDEKSREILREMVKRAYFKPTIDDVIEIEEDFGVLHWTVKTDVGDRRFSVRSPRRNIRRFGKGRLIIRDVDGNRYEIPDFRDLPLHGRERVGHYI